MRRPWLFAAVAVSMLVLSGCGDDKYKGDSNLQKPTAVAQSGVTLDGNSNTKIASGDSGISDALGVNGKIPGATEPVGEPVKSDKDYVAKCDVYWKLHWAKKAVATGMTPPNMDQFLREVTEKANATETDDKKPLIDQILEHLKSGYEAEQLNRDFRNSGISVSAVPWGTGRICVKRFLETTDGSTSNDDQDYNVLSATKMRLYDKIADYEDKHHASPNDVKLLEYRQAAVQTDKLGEMLGLAGRPENSDMSAAPSLH